MQGYRGIIYLLLISMLSRLVFRFRRTFSYFWLSVVFEITVFEIVLVDSLRFAVENKKIVIFRSKACGFCPRSATRVRKNRSVITELIRRKNCAAVDGSTKIINKIPTATRAFSTTTNSIKCSQMIATTIEPEMARLSSKTCMLPFPIVDRCRNLLATLLPKWWKMPDLQLEFRSHIQRYKYFLFWRPHCYFRLSATIAIICRYFLRKSQICRNWKINNVFYSFRAMIISDFLL